MQGRVAAPGHMMTNGCGDVTMTCRCDDDGISISSGDDSGGGPASQHSAAVMREPLDVGVPYVTCV